MKFCSKESLLLTWQILGLLVKTLAADEKYPVLDKDNLTIPIQMQLSQKQKHFSEFSPSLSKFRLNFKHFEKKDNPHSFCSSEIKDSQYTARKISKNFSFSGPFNKPHGKRAQGLLKSASEQLYDIH